MQLILAPEERLLAAPARAHALQAAPEMPLRRAADSRRAAFLMPSTPRAVPAGQGGYAARLLRRALAEYQAKLESA